jgi:hypothetical protein
MNAEYRISFTDMINPTCSAGQCSVGKGEEIGKAHMTGEVARSVGIVLKRECKLREKIYYKLHTVLSYWVFYPLYMLYLNLSCEYG